MKRFLAILLAALMLLSLADNAQLKKINKKLKKETLHVIRSLL